VTSARTHAQKRQLSMQDEMFADACRLRESIKARSAKEAAWKIFKFLGKFGVPYGNRTRVAAVKGRCPRPLDERDAYGEQFNACCKLATLP
jgi:hypothetical protein